MYVIMYYDTISILFAYLSMIYFNLDALSLRIALSFLLVESSFVRLYFFNTSIVLSFVSIKIDHIFLVKFFTICKKYL